MLPQGPKIKQKSREKHVSKFYCREASPPQCIAAGPTAMHRLICILCP
jgi:hypothetical protein